MNLFRRTFLTTCAAPLLATPLFAAAPATPAVPPVLRDAAECTPRGGLPNVLAKLQAGQPVKVGYLGGSITAAPGWRVKSLKWLQEKFPTAKLSEINAAIGGTGSDLGVFRVQHDVLDHKPDLMFVEFAVNDGGADPARIQRCMEGIVRQTWKVDPATDICFVYTLSEPFLKDLKEGEASQSATAMEGVADHYQIPSIHFGVVVASLEKEGKVIFKAEKPSGPAVAGAPMIFSGDGVHPHVETGHELYLQAITRAWPIIAAKGAGAKPHDLIAPLRADNWEKAKMVPVTQEMLKGSWTKLDMPTHPIAKGYQQRLPGMWKATGPDAVLEFEIEGTHVAGYDLVGPDGGLLEVTVDALPPRKMPRIDPHCTYHRLATSVLLTGATEGRHHVKVQLLAEAPDKRKILFPKNLPDMDKNPAKYQDNVWHLGGLLLLGDLVK
ncbi:MAG TPA: SGNH/GDSL hydrolase family protein [Verrucomicrobium sp.]|nr:SGNH/GDSL hydrolase family protein [Verrucomicrobium sp.]